MRYLCIVVLVATSLVTTRSSAGAQAASPSPPSAGRCGNQLLDAGETCAQCPADCTVQPCRSGKSRAIFAVEFTPPPAPDVTTALLRIGYRSDRISVPGTGGDKSVRGRIKATGAAMLVPNDVDYALRVVVSGSKPIPPGRLLTIEFDRCEGAPAPTLSDLSCDVEACANSSGPSDACRCQIAVVKR